MITILEMGMDALQFVMLKKGLHAIVILAHAGVIYFYFNYIFLECGDGIIISPKEECDDNNTKSGDGCSSSCEREEDYICTGEPSVCNPKPSKSS